MSRWVLVKGLKQDGRHWLGFEQRVAERLGREVVLLDLPGAGTQSHVRSPRAVPHMVADLRHRLRKRVGPPEDIRLLGLSLGGMVALHWASAFPHEVAGVVVGNTSTRDTAPAHWRLSWRAWPRLGRAVLTRDAEARERVVLSMTTTAMPPERRAETAESFARLHEEAPFKPRGFVGQLLAGARFETPYVPVPVVVLSGRGDTFVDPRCSDRLAQRLGAEMRTHPEAGHDLSLDAPDWLLDELVRFEGQLGR